MLTYADFAIDYPEFAAIAQSKVERALNRAIARVDETAWGRFADEAVGLLTAHFLAIGPDTSNASAGGIASQMAGPLVSIEVEGEYAIRSATPFGFGGGIGVAGDANYFLSPYGRQYKELQRSVIVAITGT